jgi:hypothetical protein
VSVPVEKEVYYRLSIEDPENATAFQSEFEWREPRDAKYTDAVTHRGVSVRGTLQQAQAMAQELDQKIRLAGAESMVPPFRHIARIEVDGSLGHASARDNPREGLHWVWAEADDLRSSVRASYTIHGQEDPPPKGWLGRSRKG